MNVKAFNVQLNVRVTDEQRRKITQAAEAEKVSASDFVRTSVIKRASKVLRSRRAA